MDTHSNEAPVDRFIDYKIKIDIGNFNYIETYSNSALLGIHDMFIPYLSQEPLNMDDSLSLINIRVRSN